ncbi:GntR family transcriptional regulator [Nocardia sp. NPDC052254]|uniref:GntR family transcriptional regulator n=1 Tax=Nocardia sp. NPDC052254 TaxID=3155681 RepID=UPI00343E8880
MTADPVPLRQRAEGPHPTSGSAHPGSGGEHPDGARSIRKADRARQVADVLRQQIHSGRCPDPLPAETELAAEFAVSRNAVREALALLRDEGLIGRVPRVGTYVAQRKYDHDLDSLRGLKETLRGHGEVRNEVRAAVRLVPPPAVANRLGLEPGESAVYLERLRYLGDLPLSLDHTYLAPDIGAQVLDCDLRSEDIFALIERISGQSLGSADLAVEAIPADVHSAATLQTPEGSALLLLERLTHLADGRPVDLEYIRMRGDRITLRNSLIRTTEGNDWRLSRHGVGQSAG